MVHLRTSVDCESPELLVDTHLETLKTLLSKRVFELQVIAGRQGKWWRHAFMCTCWACSSHKAEVLALRRMWWEFYRALFYSVFIGMIILCRNKSWGVLRKPGMAGPFHQKGGTLISFPVIHVVGSTTSGSAGSCRITGSHLGKVLRYHTLKCNKQWAVWGHLRSPKSAALDLSSLRFQGRTATLSVGKHAVPCAHLSHEPGGIGLKWAQKESLDPQANSRIMQWISSIFQIVVESVMSALWDGTIL